MKTNKIDTSANFNPPYTEKEQAVSKTMIENGATARQVANAIADSRKAQNAQHTAGEWYAYQTDNGWYVNPCVDTMTNCPEQEANARLISAAPDLLSACEEALQALKSIGFDEFNDENTFSEVSTLEAAIKKAKGQQTRHIGNFGI